MPLQRTASRRCGTSSPTPPGLVTATAASTATTPAALVGKTVRQMTSPSACISDEELAAWVAQVAPVVGVATLNSASSRSLPRPFEYTIAFVVEATNRPEDLSGWRPALRLRRSRASSARSRSRTTL
jgi:hypothetical protein